MQERRLLFTTYAVLSGIRCFSCCVHQATGGPSVPRIVATPLPVRELAATWAWA